MNKVRKQVADINNKDFLKEQLDLLQRRQIDDSIEWQDIADYRFSHTGTLEHRDTVRKGSKLLYDYINAGWVHEPSFVQNHNDDLINLRKEQIKLSDARVELNRQIRSEARKESYADMIKRIICENVAPIELKPAPIRYNSDTDLLVHLTDIHAGIEIHNSKNDFDENTLKDRIEHYLSEILYIKNRHDSQDCYLVIGEILSGIIHNNLRLQNNMDLMEQFKYISELISDMIELLSENFNHVIIYVTPGNHSRISPKKEDALDGENMDTLLPFYLKARLQNFENVSICDNSIEPEIAMFDIRGKHIIASHGHKDSPANVVQRMTMLFGIKPDIVLLGHRHTNGLSTVYDTKVIESGCVSGCDAYAMSIRKCNKPEQTVSVIGDEGLICLYDIQLD